MVLDFHRSGGSGQPVGTSGWLYQLRWFAVFGQLLTVIGATNFYGVELPTKILYALVAFTAVTNVAYGFWLYLTRHRWDDETRPQVDALMMVIDLLILASMIYMTGGSANPFSAFFFVNLAVAGVILRPTWAWTLTALALGCYILLTFRGIPVPILENSGGDDWGRSIRLQGRVVAFATCAVVITFFVTRLANELTSRQRALREVQKQRDRSQRLEALATLAAGAAHELASPLSTIAVVAREMSRRFEQIDPDGSIRKDMKLIDGELDHCRQILSRMRSSAGDSSGETWDTATLGDLMDATVEGVREPNRIEVALETVDEETVLWLPIQTVAQVIRNLLHNALDASEPELRSFSLAKVDGLWCRIEVTDHGHGMPEDVLTRLGEPFFTTKEPGRGMGLGVFLTRNVVSRLGGHLDIHSAVGQGTRITMVLPKSLPHSDRRSTRGPTPTMN